MTKKEYLKQTLLTGLKITSHEWLAASISALMGAIKLRFSFAILHFAAKMSLNKQIHPNFEVLLAAILLLGAVVHYFLRQKYFT